jgi:hypothetical protein
VYAEEVPDVSRRLNFILLGAFMLLILFFYNINNYPTINQLDPLDIIITTSRCITNG